MLSTQKDIVDVRLLCETVANGMMKEPYSKDCREKHNYLIRSKFLVFNEIQRSVFNRIKTERLFPGILFEYCINFFD